MSAPICLPVFCVPSEVCPVYAIAPGADAEDVGTMLERRLAHLEALMRMTYGEAGGAFRGYSHTLQDNYLWACADLATECRELFRQVQGMGSAA